VTGFTRREALRAIVLGVGGAPAVLRGRCLRRGSRRPINIRGLYHSTRVFDLTEGLIRRGHTDAHIAPVLGGNAIRVLGTIWPA
jgi:microsomal dipeptidase-like Zn-dependent dipeptidase